MLKFTHFLLLCSACPLKQVNLRECVGIIYGNLSLARADEGSGFIRIEKKIENMFL